jgi:CheY-like chemotaxis protein
MTANAMLEDREICLSAGMNNYIAKPVKLDELVTMLEETFRLLK